MLARSDGVVSNVQADIGSSIAAYTAALRSRLRGPARHRASLVAEARDGLEDAAEAYRAGGLDDAAAQRQAVADFGTLPEVLPAYQAELGVVQGRRVATVLALGSPLMHLASELTWRYQPSVVAWQPPSSYRLLADVVDVGSYLIAAAAVLALVGFGVGSRWLGTARLVRVVAGGALAVVTTSLLSGLALTLFAPHLTVSWQTVAQGVASYAIFGYTAWAAARCFLITPARVERPLAGC